MIHRILLCKLFDFGNDSSLGEPPNDDWVALASPGAKSRDGGFGTDCLVWHPTQWEVYCPHGTLLQPQSDGRSGRQAFVGTACEQCGLYARCHPSGEGAPKKFTLDPVHHRRWQQNREHCRTDEYKAAQKARFVEEGRFGLAKMKV